MNRHANVVVTVPIDQPEPSAPAFCCRIARMSGLLHDLSAEFGFKLCAIQLSLCTDWPWLHVSSEALFTKKIHVVSLENFTDGHF